MKSTATLPETGEHPPRMKPWKALALLLALCYTVAGAGHLFMASTPAELRKHAFHPPNHLLVPGWIVLYSCMAVAAWLIWRRPPGILRSRALLLFSIQLILNFIWMMDFFYYQVVGPALFILLVLWATVLLTTMLFWQIRRLTGYLMAPYMAWLAYAFSLNFDIFSLG